jgi:hypothetical protein
MNREKLEWFLRKNGIDKFSHVNTGGLLGHLLGSYDIIKDEHGDELIALVAGLHSVYGTTIYKKQMLPLHSSQVTEQFGENVDRLVRLFGATPREQIYTTSNLTNDLYIMKWVEYANLKEQFRLHHDKHSELIAFIKKCKNSTQLKYVR